MTNSNVSINLGNDGVVLLRIGSKPQEDGRRWDRQVALIKSTGAEFHDDKAWYLRVNGPLLTSERLLPLWQAVAEYGTSVRVDLIEPPTDSQAQAGADAGG